MSLKILPHFLFQGMGGCRSGYFHIFQGKYGGGWVDGWGGWKPLLQMDLELVRQQISSQAKKGGPANNFIFFSVQKRWELDIHVFVKAIVQFFLLCQILSLLYPDKLKNSEFEWEQF